MAIYITGDCHRDYRRFTTNNFPEQKEMTKDDYVIILGDFGYWDDSPENKYWMDWLDAKPFTTLFVDGNHENFDMLKTLKYEEWHGGAVQKINDSVIHLIRGEIYDIEGCTFWCFGGARSHDIKDGILELDDPDFKRKKKELDARHALYRVNHTEWWAEEMPSRMEMEFGLAMLEDYGNEVDFILTHDAPLNVINLLWPGLINRNELNTYFDYINEKIKFKKWFFGHHHDNRNIGTQHVLLYEQIIRIN